MRISPPWVLAFGALTAVLLVAVVTGAREVLVLTVLVTVLTGAYLLRSRMRRRLLYDRDARRGGRP
ncbi:MAG TPA: hypothetical protein VFH03_18735 [Actinoplanes sp.]|nr:hypothetical protein [Actinoplanes sp.]